MTQKEDEAILLNIGILSTRKIDFVRNLLEAVDKNLPTGMSTYEKRRLHDALARVVSELPYGFFISDKETKSRQLDPSMSLVDLQLDSEKIWGEMVKRLRATYPGLAAKLDTRKKKDG